MRILIAAVPLVVGLAASLSAQSVSTFPDLPLRLNVGDEVSVEGTAGLGLVLDAANVGATTVHSAPMETRAGRARRAPRPRGRRHRAC